jgi:6-phosphofructokinase
MNVGIITPGRISPGVNTCITEIALREKQRHNKVIGVVEGWRGLNHGFMEDIFITGEARNEPGSILHTSREPLNMKLARRHILTLDRLYCIGDAQAQRDARTIFCEDLPVGLVGITGFGMQSKLEEVSRYIRKCHVLAESIHGVVFLEIEEKYGEVTRNASMSEPHANVVITPEDHEDFLFDIQHQFAMNGHCVVVVNACCDYGYILDALKVYNVDTKIIRPDAILDVSTPCVYDNILCSRISREACEHVELRKNFVCDAGRIIPYAFYPETLFSIKFNVV